MARIASGRAQKLNLVVDLDVGLGRGGVLTPDAALALAKLILGKGMQFRGLMGYGGSIRLPPSAEKSKSRGRG